MRPSVAKGNETMKIAEPLFTLDNLTCILLDSDVTQVKFDDGDFKVRPITIVAIGPGGAGKGRTIEEARTEMMLYSGLTNSKKDRTVLNMVRYAIVFEHYDVVDVDTVCRHFS